MYELPRPILCKIISYMDIDTRRSLGIYTKLKVPKDLEYKLNNIKRNIKSYRSNNNYSIYSIDINNNTYTRMILNGNKVIYYFINIKDNDDEIYYYGYKDFKMICSTIDTNLTYDFRLDYFVRD